MPYNTILLNNVESSKHKRALDLIAALDCEKVIKYEKEISVALTNILLKRYYDPIIPEDCDITVIEGMLSYAKNGVLFISTRWWRLPKLALEMIDACE